MARGYKQLNVGEVGARLVNAKTASEVRGILQEAVRIGISHAALNAAGFVPEGYGYNAAAARFRPTQRAAAESATSRLSVLGDVATAAHAVVIGYYEAATQGIADGWNFPGPRQLPKSKAVASIKKNNSPGKRAEMLRRCPGVSTIPLVFANPKGLWGAMSNGAMGTEAVAAILAAPFVPPVLSTIVEPQLFAWGVHPAAEKLGLPLLVRRERTHVIEHSPLVITHHDAAIRETRRQEVSRSFTLVHDTVFVANSADTAQVLLAAPDMLTDAYQARGEGYKDDFVPVAGILTVRQTIEPVANQ